MSSEGLIFWICEAVQSFQRLCNRGTGVHNLTETWVFMVLGYSKLWLCTESYSSLDRSLVEVPISQESDQNPSRGDKTGQVIMSFTQN